MEVQKRSIEVLTDIIPQFLDRHSIRDDNCPWELRRSELGGFGVFATRSIEVGELVFRDSPVILGPRAALTSPIVCVGCYKRDNLQKCGRNCGLQVCSQACQDSSGHQKECKIIRQWQTKPIEEELCQKLTKVLSPIRSLLLSMEDKAVVTCLKAHRSNQHGFEVDIMKDDLGFNLKEDEEQFMRFVCSVLDSNAFEVIVGVEENQSSVRGLYPLGSLANHCCTPNTMHVFDDQQRMIVRAANFISKDEEIFHSYSRLIWSSQARRFHLFKTKHFWCRCLRCKDPTEFGTYMGAILCKNCSGMVIPIDPLKLSTQWKCENCQELLTGKNIASLTSLLGSALKAFDREDLIYMLRFLEHKLPTMVPENNETTVEIKYRIIWILGYYQGHGWTELTDQLLQIKQKFCRDLLALVEALRAGQSKIRGLLLYELYCCLKENKRRGEKSGSVSKDLELEMRNLLDEASDILKYDVGAPTEIKRNWST